MQIIIIIVIWWEIGHLVVSIKTGRDLLFFANKQFLNSIRMKLFSLACLAASTQAYAVERADGCFAGAFKQLQLDIAKCEAMENPSDVEEFKCVTGIFKNFFVNTDKCIHPSAVGDGPGGISTIQIVPYNNQDKILFWRSPVRYAQKRTASTEFSVKRGLSH